MKKTKKWSLAKEVRRLSRNTFLPVSGKATKRHDDRRFKDCKHKKRDQEKWAE